MPGSFAATIVVILYFAFIIATTPITFVVPISQVFHQKITTSFIIFQSLTVISLLYSPPDNFIFLNLCFFLFLLPALLFLFLNVILLSLSFSVLFFILIGVAFVLIFFYFIGLLCFTLRCS